MSDTTNPAGDYRERVARKIREALPYSEDVVIATAAALSVRDEEMARLRSYVETTRYHHQQHADAHRRAERLQARIDAGLALHAPDLSGDCKTCRTADMNPVSWPCDTAAALTGEDKTDG